MILLGIILLGAFIYALFTYCQRRYLSPLASVPIAPANHFLIKYLGLVPPPNDKDTKDLISEFLIRLGQDVSFSPVAVCWSIFGKPLVIVNTLKGIKDVLIDGQTKGKLSEKTPRVQRGDLICLIQNLVFGGKNINNTIGQDWKWRRHILLPSFQPKQLVPRLLPFVARRVGTLLEEFESHANAGTALELDGTFMDLTMDIINFYLYGRDELNYGIVGGRKNMKYEHNRLGLGFQSVEAWLPFGLNKTNWAQSGYKPSRDKLKAFIKDSLSIALTDYKAQLKEFEEQGIPEKDRTYQSVAACAFASGKYDGDDHFDLINDLLSLTFAGYDTTAHTMAFTFAELAQNPSIQEELFQQVRSVLGPPPLAPEDITAEKLSQMPLVTAVYREALRKYPAVVFIPVHVNRDITVEGTVVPAGAEVWCNVRGVQMNPRIFPNPEKFDPSRYLVPEHAKAQYSTFDNFNNGNNTYTEVTPENQYSFPDLTFTLGQHACMGKNLSILELRTVIACTVNQFKLKLREGSIIDTKVALTTKPRHGVWVYFEKRQ